MSCDDDPDGKDGVEADGSAKKLNYRQQTIVGYDWKRGDPFGILVIRNIAAKEGRTVNLWRKMLSGVWPEQTKEMEEDTFSVEIKRALEEEKDFWKNPSEFVEPCEVAAFRERWGSAYHTAKSGQKSVC